MTGPKVSQLPFDLFLLSFSKRGKDRECALGCLNSSVLTTVPTPFQVTAPLRMYQFPWYDIYVIWFILAFCEHPHPNAPRTLDLIQRLCILWLNVLWSEGRHCCCGWSLLMSQTPMKEVVLHLPKGHLRHISYYCSHSLTRLQSCGRKPKTASMEHTVTFECGCFYDKSDNER